MKNLVFKRVLPVALALVLCFSFSVPVFALTFDPERADANDISQRIGTANGTWKQLQIYYIGGIASAPNFGVTKSVFDGYFVSDYPTDSYAPYVFVSMDALTKLAKQADFPVSLTYLPSLNIYVLIFDGEFGTTDTDTEANMVVEHFGDLTGSAMIYQSVPSTSSALFPYRIVAAFAPGLDEDVPADLNSPSAGTSEHNYYTDNSSSDTVVNVDGSQTVTNNYQSGDTYNTETFDYSNGTWYDNVTGTVNDIESLHFNPVTNTYTVNNTYNITYEYNYTYYYNLGSSENLVQDYKFYYELPDGRSSSDLTADEIAGLSLEFDVVNYAQDRTDENTKILVPFDGSWEDTAYNGPDLIWRTGASITYKESAAFNGALYIDGSNPSIFGFGPSRWNNQISSQGMTLQFRYYCDAFHSSNTYQNQSLIFSPFSYSNASRYAFAFPYYYIKPNGQIWFGVGSDYSTQIGNSGFINVQAGSLSGGVWNDICVSVVPQTGGRLEIVLYLNGQLVHSYGWPPSSYSGYYTPSFYPVFGFNVKTLVFRNFPITDSRFVSSGISYNSNSEAMPYQMIDNLRLVDFALYDGSSSSNFVPTPVPFDTNLVYVLPDTTNIKDNTIAVQSGIPVSGYRIGGVRPTFPDVGMVWMPLDGNKIADCQIYRGNYWESVGCRVWTGERWVPAWAFDVVTLSDLWDMYGGEETDNYTEITPGSFFQWFQQHFLEFKTSVIERLDRILQALGIQTDDTDVTEPDADGNSNFTFFQFFDNLFSTQQKEESGVVADALGDLLDLAKRFIHSIAAFFSGFAVMDGLGSDYLQAASDALSGVSDLVSGVWLAIPSEIQDVTVACFMFVVFGALVAIFV